MKEMRGEMRQVGRCLQVGKMATPRAGADKLGGSATAVGPAREAGEDRVIWETCRTRSEEATVTVTQRGKLIGVTETCTRERKKQLRRKARLRYAEIVKEQGVKQSEGRE